MKYQIGGDDGEIVQLGSNSNAFQREKDLAADGLIVPATWRAAWEEPVT